MIQIDFHSQQLRIKIAKSVIKKIKTTKIIFYSFTNLDNRNRTNIRVQEKKVYYYYLNISRNLFSSEIQTFEILKIIYNSYKKLNQLPLLNIISLRLNYFL